MFKFEKIIFTVIYCFFVLFNVGPELFTSQVNAVIGPEDTGGAQVIPTSSPQSSTTPTSSTQVSTSPDPVNSSDPTTNTRNSSNAEITSASESGVTNWMSYIMASGIIILVIAITVFYIKSKKK